MAKQTNTDPIQSDSIMEHIKAMLAEGSIASSCGKVIEVVGDIGVAEARVVMFLIIDDEIVKKFRQVLSEH